MRVKLDENLPRAARDRLLTFAWDVHDVYDEGLESAVDTQIQEACETCRPMTRGVDSQKRNDLSKIGGVAMLAAN